MIGPALGDTIYVIINGTIIRWPGYHPEGAVFDGVPVSTPNGLPTMGL